MIPRGPLVVVGGGAAGLAAAIFTAERIEGRFPVIVLDGARSLGAKILISGGGRCNVTHDRVTPSDFNAPPRLVRRVLAAFDERRTVAWFESLGVPLKVEATGKLFPVSDRARTIVDALLARAAEVGVRIRTGFRVAEVAPVASGGFTVRGTGEEAVAAERVVLATGGLSLPKTGSDGHGYAIARSLGHTVGETWPALVPLLLEEGFFHESLSGVSHPAELTVRAGGRALDRRAGDHLWTHFGISGPVVLDASRHFLAARRADPAAELRLSFLPGADAGEADRRLLALVAAAPKAGVARVLGELLPQRVAAALAAHVGLDPAAPAGALSRTERGALVAALTDLRLPVAGDRGYRFAEVTAGGVPLSEVNLGTMESRIRPGLYLVGEILDCDGRIGGFNFQWAWSTAYVAARALAAP